MCEVSDNDSEENASETCDYEDTEEARSEKTVIARRNMKNKIMRIYDRGGGGGSQMMNSLEDCLSQPIVNANPPVNRPETEYFQLFFTDNLLEEIITKICRKNTVSDPLQKKLNMA
ncbi:hypothetical protein JTB14_010317 [Gonioctena quinquepunctata]|nr:hypothetical protein JTB14_010317 [Gonioctena quinquepunctata]